MSIYIATAISKRPEKTEIGRLAEAQGRIEQIKKDFIETFDVMSIEFDQRFELKEIPSWLQERICLFEYIQEELERKKGCQYEGLFTSTFTENPIEDPAKEYEAMGRCVSLVMRSDIIIIDKGIKLPSKGMLVEEFVAKTYDKAIIYYHGK